MISFVRLSRSKGSASILDLLSLFVAILFALPLFSSGAPVQAQQIPDPDFKPPIEKPAYADGKETEPAIAAQRRALAFGLVTVTVREESKITNSLFRFPCPLN